MILRRLKIFIFCLVPLSLISGSKFDISHFISDTLVVQLPVDSLELSDSLSINIIDDRNLPEQVIGIQQTKKWKYIPVDQFVVLQEPLRSALQKYISRDSVKTSGALHIKNLTLWTDGKPFFNKGRKLNAYTVLEDSTGQIISNWMWEFTIKRKRKQKSEVAIAALMDQWMTKQASVITQKDYKKRLYPYLYRRQLINWYDLILLSDGFIVNAHLTLDFPPDQQKYYIRGSPGIYYRKSIYHESIAISGKDQHWYRRINDRLLRKLNVTYRFGFNNFDSHHYSHLDFWNLFLINIGVTAAFEYRPVYHKGLFFGFGLHGEINILPDVIDRFEPGLLLTVGIILP